MSHGLIERFYAAFHARDGATMAASYHADARFSDPVFPRLDAAGAGAMWTMLTSRATDLQVTVQDIRVEDEGGSCRWLARYTFGATGRFVVNDIRARFRFRDGLILQHDDVFDFWRWSRQALGAPGLLLGWTPLLQRRVQAKAARQLAKFRATAAR